MLKERYKDQEAEIILERIENKPQNSSLCKGTILAVNSNGLYLDINKSFEGFVNLGELGEKNLDFYRIGEQIDCWVLGEDKQQEGLFRLSIKELENEAKWQILEGLQGQNLEAKIHKILKTGIEVELESTGQIAFVPYTYIDNKQEQLKNKDKNSWLGLRIPVRLHEFDKKKNKIILNNRIITDEIKNSKIEELIKGLALGQELEVEILRITDFGAFVDLGGLDALIPSSELSWRRFKKTSEVVKIGEKIKAKIFKIEQEQKRIALSVKQAYPDPWTVIPEEIKIGFEKKAKVVSQADFGVFVELLPGIEALLHKSNYNKLEPNLGDELSVEIINLDLPKRRIGVKALQQVLSMDQAKELEHV